MGRKNIITFRLIDPHLEDAMPYQGPGGAVDCVNDAPPSVLINIP